MGLLSKLFKKKENTSSRDIVYSEDSYVRSMCLYNSPSTFMILIKFTEDFMTDMANFCIACQYSNIRASIAYVETDLVDEESKAEGSSDEEQSYAIEVEKKPEQNIYCICSGSPSNYANIYRYINTISNSILTAIESDIYEDIIPSGDMFKTLIGDGILDSRKFIHDIYHAPIYDADIPLQNCAISNFHTILKRLPSRVFSLKDVLELSRCVTKSNIIWVTDASISDPVDEIDIKKIIECPRYNYEDEYYADEAESYDIDDIFLQSYERFNALGDFVYEDIDEVIVLPESTNKPPQEE